MMCGMFQKAHVDIYVYVYIYMCVCVCNMLVVAIDTYTGIKKLCWFSNTSEWLSLQSGLKALPIIFIGALLLLRMVKVMIWSNIGNY